MGIFFRNSLKEKKEFGDLCRRVYMTTLIRRTLYANKNKL